MENNIVIECLLEKLNNQLRTPYAENFIYNNECITFLSDRKNYINIIVGDTIQIHYNTPMNKTYIHYISVDEYNDYIRKLREEKLKRLLCK